MERKEYFLHEYFFIKFLIISDVKKSIGYSILFMQ